jgi:hypothetical protein
VPNIDVNAALTTHKTSTDHDGQYYPKTTIDSFLGGKASSSHTHGNVSNDGKIGSDGDKVVTTTTDGLLTTSTRSGIDSRTVFPPASHNHDASYSAITHNHVGVYEAAGAISTHASVSNAHHNPVSINVANGLSLSTQALSLAIAIADGSAGAMSGTDKSKLDGIEAGAEANNIGDTDATNLIAHLTADVIKTVADVQNAHLTTDGNKHVPANGTTNNGKVLTATATAGSYSWAAITSITIGLGNVTNHAQMKRDANDYSAISAKSPLADADVILLEDSADSFVKKKVTRANLFEMNNAPLKKMKTASFYAVYNNTNSLSINWTNGQKQKTTINANGSFSFTAPDGPCNLTLMITQGTSLFTTGWPATVKWPSGVAPPTFAISSVNVVNFFYDGTYYYGSYGLNYAVPS